MLLVSFTAGLYEKFNLVIIPFLITQPKFQIPEKQVPFKLGQLSSMQQGLGIGLNLIIGPLYDMIGRRIPCIVMFMSTILGEVMAPNVKTFNPGLIISILL